MGTEHQPFTFAQLNEAGDKTRHDWSWAVIFRTLARAEVQSSPGPMQETWMPYMDERSDMEAYLTVCFFSFATDIHFCEEIVR